MKKFLLMLGLCKKAGALIIGTPLVTDSLPKGKVKAVLLASDASANTEKRVTDKCTFYKTTLIKASLSSVGIADAIGKSGAVCTLGITDENFSSQLIKLIEEMR